MENNIPKITTRETEYLRSFYPSLSHLEAGRVAEWLQERKDQLLEQAQTAENEADAARVLGLLAAGVGTVCYAVNPFMLVGGMVGGAAWLWFVVDHYNRTKEIAPLPFVRGNFLDALSRAGDYDARQDYRINHLAETIKFLPRHNAQEYVFLYSDYFETVIDYLSQVEPGKRFYAYRWLLGWFEKFQGRSLPKKDQLDTHLQTVTIDSRVKVEEVRAIQETVVPRFVDLPKPNLVDLPHAQNQPALNATTNSTLPPNLGTMPLDERGLAVINALQLSGFKIDEMMGSQVIAIAGTQRGGKGTLAAILAILSSALDPNLNTQYFTAGVDVYPFACKLHSALKYSDKDSDTADRFIAQDLLMFLKGLDGSHPYSHKNLLLVIDEAMRLLSLLEESDRTWAIQYLLSRFAKTGGTLIIVLHGSNLTSVVGKATAGLANTFKQSVSFIGCVAKSVNVGGLRKINVASGEYFKANPNDFGSPVAGGQLGAVPEWLKTELHPGNGQPDPARTLLKLFPELQQHHTASESPSPIPRGEKLAPKDAVAHLESVFKKEAVEPEIVEVDDPLDDSALEKIVEIVHSAIALPVKFESIRKSRKWDKNSPSVPQLRKALLMLVEAKKLHGNEEVGYEIKS
ncbi:hypothetical protein F7734_12935 [Scytonema sp. UIC 10036]|nr:hypothetical protein [Scytonema sp. UIC 10036]